MKRSADCPQIRAPGAEWVGHDVARVLVRHSIEPATGHQSRQMRLSTAGRQVIVVDESECRVSDFGAEHRLDGLGEHHSAPVVIRHRQVRGVTSGFGAVFLAPAERPLGDQIGCTTLTFELTALDRLRPPAVDLFED